MGDRVESLAAVDVDNIDGSPVIYPASHAIVWEIKYSSILKEKSYLFRKH